MRKLGKLFVIVAVLALVAMALPAQAQSSRYTVETLLSAGVQPASTATNRNVVIDVRNQPSFTLQMDTVGPVGDSTLGYAIGYSVDGVTYTPGVMRTFTSTGTNTWMTNPPTFGCGYVKIYYTTNATGATNISSWTIKSPVNFRAPNP